MPFKGKANVFFSTVVVAILLLSGFDLFMEKGEGKETRLIYIAHSPISINGDADLASQAAAESWGGSGTESDPYIISGYLINGTGSDHGISIRDTSLHIEIRYNLIKDTEFGEGVIFQDCSNITLVNNTVRNSYGPRSIKVNYCDSIKLSENLLENYMLQYGIWITYSNDLEVSSNTIRGYTGIGLYISEGSKIEVRENNVEDIGGTGMAFGNSDGIVIKGNHVRNSARYGIYCYFSSDNVELYSNMLEGNQFKLDNIDSTIITSNNTVDGLAVRQYTDQNMESIDIPADTSQIYLYNVSNFHLREYDYSMGYEFLEAHHSTGLTVENCEFFNGSRIFHFNHCEEVSVTNSSFVNITGKCILQWYGTGAVYKDNDFDAVEEVLSVSQTRNVTFSRNNMRCRETGVSMVQTKGTVVTENNLISLDDALSGIYLTIPEKLELADNQVSGFEHIGIYINAPRDGFVRNNMISGWGNSTKSEGLNISSPRNVVVSGNHIGGHWTGASLSYTSSDSSFESNIIEDNNGPGIRLRKAEGHRILGNLIFNNSGFAIECRESENCLITNNTIIENQGSGDSFSSTNIQAKDDGNENIWNGSGSGNYWRDWTTPDDDEDGIVDLPYLIFSSTSYDNHPLAEPSYTYLSKPLNFNAVGNKDSVMLSWDLPQFDLDGSLKGFIIHRSGGSGPDLDIELDGSTTNYTDTEVDDGVTYTYELRGVNRYGEGRQTDILEATPDSSKPMIDFTNPENGTVIPETGIELAWNYSDNVGVVSVELSRDGVSWMDLGLNNSYPASNLSQGANEFHIRAFDEAGNNGTDHIEIIVDTTDPAVEILDPDNGTVVNASLILVEWTGSDDVTSIGSFSYRIGAGEWNDEGSNTSANISLPSEGEYRIRIRAEDLAGNTATDSIDITVDMTPPDVFFVFPPEGYNTTDTSFNVSWAAYDTLSGVMEFRLSIDGGMPLGLLPSVTKNTLTGLSVGEHNIVLSAIDNAGNVRTIEVNFSIQEEDTEPKTAVLKGRVIDEDGEPVHKAMVKADTGDYTYTDSMGYFALEVDRGQRTINIKKSGFRSIDVQVDATSFGNLQVGNVTLEKKDDDEDDGFIQRSRDSTFCQVCCILSVAVPLLLILLGLIARATKKKKKAGKRKSKRVKNSLEE